MNSLYLNWLRVPIFFVNPSLDMLICNSLPGGAIFGVMCFRQNAMGIHDSGEMERVYDNLKSGLSRRR